MGGSHVSLSSVALWELRGFIISKKARKPLLSCTEGVQEYYLEVEGNILENEHGITLVQGDATCYSPKVVGTCSFKL